MGWFSRLFGFGKREPAKPPAHAGTILRGGVPQPIDNVFRAWSSGGIPQMLKELNTPTNPIDRHFLLLNIVERAYKERKKSPEMRELCEQISRIHIEEFSNLAPALRKQFKDVNGKGMLPRVPTFQHLATLLGEDGRTDEAIAVCEAALRYGLHDGTQGGFKKRIERFLKQKGRKPKTGK